MTSRSLGHRAPLLWALLPLIAGLSLGKLEWLPAAPAWLGFAAASLVMAAMLYGYSRKWELRRGGFWLPPALVVLALVLGAQFD